jgi:hypothetical protein
MVASFPLRPSTVQRKASAWTRHRAVSSSSCKGALASLHSEVRTSGRSCEDEPTEEHRRDPTVTARKRPVATGRSGSPSDPSLGKFPSAVADRPKAGVRDSQVDCHRADIRGCHLDRDD